jgi:hypothetical protein
MYSVIGSVEPLLYYMPSYIALTIFLRHICAMKQVLEIKVTLDQTDPPIWRRILVPADVTFFDLHHILQIAMGWKNSHLFEFKVGDYKIGYEDDDLEGSDEIANAGAVTLDTLLLKEGLRFSYVYDLGDYWMHTVVVERILAADSQKIYPACIEGELNCPPEDCGSIPGFYHMVEVLKDKSHPEYEDMRTWAGRYNPSKFNMEKINKELPRYRKYMKDWEK